MIAQPAPPSTTQSMPMAGRAWSLLTLRLGMVLVISLLIWVILRSAGGISAFHPTPSGPPWACCLSILSVSYWWPGFIAIKDSACVRPWASNTVVSSKTLAGVVILIVLNVPFALAVSDGVAMYGTQAPEAFGTIFVNPAAQAPSQSHLATAHRPDRRHPVYRAQRPGRRTGLPRIWSQRSANRPRTRRCDHDDVVALWRPTYFLLPQPSGMLVYFAAFTVWGGIAAIIVTKQGRLLPIIIAHWMINFMPLHRH